MGEKADCEKRKRKDLIVNTGGYCEQCLGVTVSFEEKGEDRGVGGTRRVSEGEGF